jgi:hypothetical protein
LLITIAPRACIIARFQFNLIFPIVSNLIFTVSKVENVPCALHYPTVHYPTCSPIRAFVEQDTCVHMAHLALLLAV